MSTQVGGFSLQYGRDGGTVVVQVAGDVDAATAPQLEHGLTSMIHDQGNLAIRVDMGRVTFIDSTALTVLVRGLRDVRGRGGDLVLANPSPRILRVLDIVGLTTVFGISPDGATTTPTDDFRSTATGR